MLAYFFGSLAGQADKWITEWEDQSNGNLKQLPWFTRTMFYFSERPFRHLSVLFVVATTLALICERFTEWIGVSKVIANYDHGDFLTFFTGLWSLQATLAALVYPLVVAFVAVLLQRRASAKLSLRLYALEAAIAPAAMSTLALVACMTLQYFALPYVALDYIAAAMVGNIFWAFCNILLTGWFLYRTVQFFDDEVRYRSFIRYAVHTALQREARVHLLGLMLSNAQAQGQLPKGSDEWEKDGPIVHIYPIGDGAPAVVVDNSRRKAVIDVRMRLLRWAISLWLREVRRSSGDKRSQRYSERPTLTVEFTPGEEAPEKLIICKVKNAKPPSRLARLFLRHSVLLGPPILSSASVATTDVLEELAVESLTLLEDKRIEAARETLQALVNVHIALVKAGSFTNDEGQEDNVGLLSAPYGWGSQALHYTWLKPYRELAKASVNLLGSQLDVFERHSHLLQRLAYGLADSHPRILIGLVNIAGYLSYRLSQWWVEQVEERNLPHNVSVGAVLPNPIQVTYNRAMKSFIEGLENAQLYRREDTPMTVRGKWSHYCRVAAFESEKLCQIATLTLEAAMRGDLTAADWLLDSFFHWRSSPHLQLEYVSFDEDRYRDFDFSIFNESWDIVRPRLSVQYREDEMELAKQLFETKMRDRWKDMRLVLVLILLDWTDSNQAESAFSVDLIVDLLKGRTLQGSLRGVHPVNNVENVLVRLFDMKLDFVIREATEMRRPEMVAGRIYTRSGSDTLDSLLPSQFWLLVILTQHELNRTQKLDALIGKNGRNLEALTRLARRARELAAKGDAFAGDRGYAIVSEIRRRVKVDATAEEACEWVVAMLGRFTNSAKSAYDAAVAGGAISRERIGWVRDEVTRYMRSQENAQFPFTIANSVNSGEGHGAEGHLQVNDVRKEAFADPALQDWRDSDSNAYNTFVIGAIAAELVHGCIRQRGIVPLPQDAEENFVVALAAQASAIEQAGQTPIVLLMNQFPDWVHSYRHPKPEPGAVAVTTTPPGPNDVHGLYSYLNGYAAHLTRLEGVGCLVVPKEAFASIEYATYEEDSCVAINAEEMDDNKLRLKFSWRFWLDA